MSQFSQLLHNQHGNDVISEKIEEIRDIRELQDRYESDAEYGQYADEEEIDYIRNHGILRSSTSTEIAYSEGQIASQARFEESCPYNTEDEKELYDAWYDGYEDGISDDY